METQCTLASISKQPFAPQSPTFNCELVDSRRKESNKMTECVIVPSSEHVAQIVGRQGHRIKAIRSKTDTCIKTPARDAEPVFIVKGEKDNLIKAEKEILSAASYFTNIHSSRKYSRREDGFLTITNNFDNVVIDVPVPPRLVGLVVGAKGANIKRIRQLTQTFIVTPSRNMQPIFKVIGRPSEVERAKHEIEKFVAMHCGIDIKSKGHVPNFSQNDLNAAEICDMPSFYWNAKSKPNDFYATEICDMNSNFHRDAESKPNNLYVAEICDMNSSFHHNAEFTPSTHNSNPSSLQDHHVSSHAPANHANDFSPTAPYWLSSDKNNVFLDSICRSGFGPLFNCDFKSSIMLDPGLPPNYFDQSSSELKQFEWQGAACPVNESLDLF